MKYRDYMETTKPRILLLVLLSTCVGFVLAIENFSPGLFMFALLGTALVCASCNSLNHLLERDVDAKMRRTRTRPLPAGRLTPGQVLVFGCLLGMAGLAVLTVVVNLLTAVLGALALATYLFVYTPLKRKTSLCTVIGAAPGAVPVLMGWTAARGALDWGGWTLFAIVFLWQLPHFYAIATMYRDEYAAAGLRVLPVEDMDASNRQSALYCLGLLVVSLLPTHLGLTGSIYFFCALILGLVFLAMGVCSLSEKFRLPARAVFFSSIIYLPLLFAVMILDKA